MPIPSLLSRSTNPAVELTDDAITAAIETLLSTKKGLSSQWIAVSIHGGLV